MTLWRPFAFRDGAGWPRNHAPIPDGVAKLDARGASVGVSKGTRFPRPLVRCAPLRCLLILRPRSHSMRLRGAQPVVLPDPFDVCKTMNQDVSLRACLALVQTTIA